MSFDISVEECSILSVNEIKILNTRMKGYIKLLEEENKKLKYDLKYVIKLIRPSNTSNMDLCRISEINNEYKI